jgi:GH24 family phage-related lysozyme (muramidase)
MKSILLASVATVALAGAAAAEITWSGTGSVSVGRTGSVAAVAGALTNDQIISIAGSGGVPSTVTTDAKASAWWAAATAAEKAAAVTAYGTGDILTAAEVSNANARLALLDDWLAANASWKDGTAAVAAIDNTNATTEAEAIAAALTVTLAAGDDTTGEIYAKVKAARAATAEELRVSALNKGTGAKAAGDTKMTTTGTLTAAMTVGDGYVASLSFNAGTGAFGAISLATPDMGTLTFSPNAIAATVDASDKGGDLKYTNTVGGWALAVTLDVDEDSDEAGSAADARNGVAAVASDSQWSVSASGTVSEGTTASLAFDEEGGYSMGVATSLAGLELSLGTSSTAAAGTVNTMGIGYTMGEVSIGVDYSDEDADNAYTLSLGYAMDGTAFSLAYQENADYDLSVSTSVAGFAVKLATDEDAAWSLSASTPIGNAGTLTASTNSAEAMSLTAAFKF